MSNMFLIKIASNESAVFLIVIMINFDEFIELKWHFHFMKKKRVGFRIHLISGIYLCLNR